MYILFKFEWKRFWKDNKNYFLILVIIAILFTFTFFLKALDKRYQRKYITKLNFEKSNVEDYLTNINIQIDIYEDILEANEDVDIKNILDKLYIEKEFFVNWYSVLMELYPNKNNVVKRLPHEIKRNELLLQGESKNIIGLEIIGIVNNDLESLRQETAMKKHILDKGIKPLSSPYELNLQNFYFILLSYPFSLIWVLTIFISCLDIVAEDFTCGSYKTLYAGKYERNKIYFSKLIIGVLNSIIVWLVSLGVCSIYIIFKESIGDFNYPVYFTTKGIIPYKNALLMQLISIFLFWLLAVSMVQLLSIIVKDGLNTILLLFTILIFDFSLRELLPISNKFWNFYLLNILEGNVFISNIESNALWLFSIVIQIVWLLILNIYGLKRIRYEDL